MVSFDVYSVHSLSVSSTDDHRPQRWWTIDVIGKTPEVSITLFNLPQPTGQLLQAALSPTAAPADILEAFVNYRNDAPSTINYTMAALVAAASFDDRLDNPFSHLRSSLRLLNSAHVTADRLDQADTSIADLREAFETLCDELCDESASLRAQLQPE